MRGVIKMLQSFMGGGGGSGKFYGNTTAQKRSNDNI